MFYIKWGVGGEMPEGSLGVYLTVIHPQNSSWWVRLITRDKSAVAVASYISRPNMKIKIDGMFHAGKQLRAELPNNNT